MMKYRDIQKKDFKEDVKSRKGLLNPLKELVKKKQKKIDKSK